MLQPACLPQPHSAQPWPGPGHSAGQPPAPPGSSAPLLTQSMLPGAAGPIPPPAAAHPHAPSCGSANNREPKLLHVHLLKTIKAPMQRTDGKGMLSPSPTTCNMRNQAPVPDACKLRDELESHLICCSECVCTPLHALQLLHHAPQRVHFHLPAAEAVLLTPALTAEASESVAAVVSVAAGDPHRPPSKVSGLSQCCHSGQASASAMPAPSRDAQELTCS